MTVEYGRSGLSFDDRTSCGVCNQEGKWSPYSSKAVRLWSKALLPRFTLAFESSAIRGTARLFCLSWLGNVLNHDKHPGALVKCCIVLRAVAAAH